MAVLSIQDLTVKYFEITAKTQKGSYFLSCYSSRKKLNYLVITMFCVVLWVFASILHEENAVALPICFFFYLNLSPVNLSSTSSEVNRIKILGRSFAATFSMYLY